MRCVPLLLTSALVLSLAATVSHGAEPLTFEQHIRPILKTYCLDCHGAGDELKGKLDLRLRRLLVDGGESGTSIVPGKPADSVLIHRVRAGEMPPGEKKLPPADIERLEQWIASGAPTARAEPEMIDQGIGITPEEREFWAFQPLKRPPLPAAWPQAERLRSPVDVWIAHTAAAQQLGGLSPEADRATLLRRAALDLLGLPPSDELLAEFSTDTAPDAWERVLDRLLASPRYGERWGRHWLDVAGYAESDGYTNTDAVRPYAYKYRDYVVRSLNRDKPFDQFLVEQLAGDELLGGATTNFTPQQIELLSATGFLRMAADGTGSGAPDQDLARNQVVTDTLKIVSSGLLGLTVQCAQCHNHRYDPIPQVDYYRLRAVFEPALDPKNWRVPQARLVSLYTDDDRKRAAEVEAEAAKIAAEKGMKQSEYLAAALEKELAKFPESQRETLRAAYNTPADKRTPEQNQLLKENPSVNISPGVLYQYDAKAAEELKKYDERIAAVRANKPVEDFVHSLVEPNNAQTVTHLFHRGDHRQPKDAVSPGDLTILAPAGHRTDIPADDPQLPTTGRRLALARHWTNGQHPLIGRVVVNRLWAQHFGRGLVGTLGDFGMLGDRPTHPELLDWLATELPQSEWSLKRLHRLLLTSSVYRQSSVRDPQRSGRDDDNRYYTRMSVRRLDAEVVRDRMLSASGTLRNAMYGPSVPIKEDEVGQVVVGGDDARRSVYVQVRRSQPLALLTAFDAPVMETNCERRTASTVATQSLMLMNGEFVLRQASELALLVRRRVTEELASTATPTTLPIPAAVLELGQQTERVRRASVWQYGTGQFDASTQRVAGFQALPHWNGSQWQGGAQLPDAARGWALLHAQGGHPGDDQARAVVRRWTAPVRGTVIVRGSLSHPVANGDGVRARVVSSRHGVTGEWTAHNGSATTESRPFEVEPGDTIDLIVDCRTTVESDSFAWPVDIQLQAGANAVAGAAGQGSTVWNSANEFQGPAPAPLPLVRVVRAAWHAAYGREPSENEYRAALDHFARQLTYLQSSGSLAADKTNPALNDAELRALTNLCQVLLTSNEFLYVE